MEKYRNPELNVKERVEDLLARMTFEEKIDQITCLVTITPDVPDFRDYVPNGIGNVGAFTVSDDVTKVAEYTDRLQHFLVEETRLGIPALVHCEATAGAQFTEANVFPSAIAQASTFDTDLVRSMGNVIREQLLQVGFRQALSPVIDIARDPRWGRVTETYGEDPTLSAAMGDAFVSALQTKDLRHGVIATAKHFVGHGITEGGLNMGRNLVSERELREVHAKPFQCAITQSGLGSVMNSYCNMNGEPVVGSKHLLTDLLRGEMGFAGFVVSDYISLDRMVEPFCVASNYTEAGVRAIKAGLDVEYPRPKGYTYALKKEVESGNLSMDTIDQAVRRVLTAKFELGLFENPYPNIPALKASLHRPEVDKLNEKLAAESIILLRNEHETLPLDRREIRRIAVIGPHADSVRSYFGTFSYPATLDMTDAREIDGDPMPEPGLIVYDFHQAYPGQIRDISPRIERRIRKEFPHTRSLVQALREYLPECEVVESKGINCAGMDIGGMEEALSCAAQADVVLLTLGGKNGWGMTSTVGEGVDSTSIDLPGQQELFARKVYELHKKTVVLHFDGRPLSNVFVASHFDAILEVWQPGEMGGQALCGLLFGDYNPSGRLPVTAARNAGQLPVYYSLPRGSGYVGAGHTGMIRNPNGYVNDTCYPLYYFGYGLSYTSFEYRNLSVATPRVHPGDDIEVTFTVCNTGIRDGAEIVQLYYSDEVASMVRPELELGGFARVEIPVGESRYVTFRMKVTQTAFLNEDMNWCVEKGVLKLMLGASSQDIRLTTNVEILEDALIDGKTRGFYADVQIR